MGMLHNILKPAVAAASITFLVSSQGFADEARLNLLMDQLRVAEVNESQRLAADIQLEWEKSGSASADLLLSRGNKAMEAGQVQSAIEHFTALTDHAPDFAEGWVSRANAFAHAEMFGPALADLEVALELNPRHFEAIAGLGAILEVIERPTDAYEAYQLVTPIHPHHPAVTEALKRLEPIVMGQKL